MKIFKKLFKLFGYTLIFLFVLFMGFVIYYTEPYIVETEVRATGNRETIRGIYGRACEQDFIADEDGLVGKLTLVVPEGGIGPQDTKAMVPDNIFVLTGYRYKTLRRNVFTGKVDETYSPRFDVVEWHAVLPYRIFEAYDYVEVNTPLGWKSTDLEPLFQSYLPSVRNGC